MLNKIAKFGISLKKSTGPELNSLKNLARTKQKKKKLTKKKNFFNGLDINNRNLRCWYFFPSPPISKTVSYNKYALQ